MILLKINKDHNLKFVLINNRKGLYFFSIKLNKIYSSNDRDTYKCIYKGNKVKIKFDIEIKNIMREILITPDENNIKSFETLRNAVKNTMHYSFDIPVSLVSNKIKYRVNNYYVNVKDIDNYLSVRCYNENKLVCLLALKEDSKSIYLLEGDFQCQLNKLGELKLVDNNSEKGKHLLDHNKDCILSCINFINYYSINYSDYNLKISEGELN